ncbi:MAG: hypothetical protein QG652_886 [Pseudomonadota bacterium]|nr:hypothetical protein [Pseudomonadota bacterium]
MELPRNGENRNIPFRSNRYFCINGAWYFTTREGPQLGPFIDKREAEAELMLFVREKTLQNSNISA